MKRSPAHIITYMGYNGKANGYATILLILSSLILLRSLGSVLFTPSPIIAKLEVYVKRKWARCGRDDF